MTDFRHAGTLEMFRRFAKSLPKTHMVTARQAGPTTGETYPDGPILVDYVGIMSTPKMTSQELLSHLRIDVEKYAPDCAESVKRNRHMHEDDGHITIKAADVEPWLNGFCERFATRYKGPQRTGDVAMEMVKCARLWRYAPNLAEWKGPGHLDQAGRDAVLTDFINFVAGRRGVDFALYSKDLKVTELGDEAYT